MRTWAVCTAALALAGCPRAIRREPADSLSGFTAPLSFGAGLRLVVDGSVDDAPADIVLDVASPLSMVTADCLSNGRNLYPDRAARVRQVDGTTIGVDEVALPPARIGSRRIGARMVGVIAGQRRCVLSLGTDVLSQYAIQFDPERHSIALSGTLARSSYLQSSFPATEEVHIVELARDPETDWPLLSARLNQGTVKSTSTFILSSRSEQSMLSEDEARAIGFQPAAAAPLEKFLNSNLGRRVAPFHRFALDSFELSPSFGIHRLTVRGDPAWKNPAAAGLLGSDVWGRFHATIDIGAGLLILRRPRTSSAGDRQLCAVADGRASEEACFVLNASKLGDSLSVVSAIWRDLPEGGRLHLDPVDAQGRPLQSACQYGLSFQPGDRGLSMRRDFPWQAVEQAFPECAEAVRRADGFALSLFEDGPLSECQGECAFVRRRGGRKVLCACASALDDS
jgi:hypothetical protein